MPSGIAMADFIWSTPVCLSDPADLCAELCTFRMETASLSVIGILMPGILAREIDRQGFFDAFLAIAATTLFTALILLLIGQKLPGV